MIWRDDDISVATDLAQFKAIHELFIKYNVTHTIAVICEDIELNIDLLIYLKITSHIDIQIHCWDHYDITLYTEVFESDLKKCIKKIKEVFGIDATTYYPAWNRANEENKKAIEANGLTLSKDKISLSKYLRTTNYNGVINFHYWADECKDLEAALIKYTNENSNPNS